MSETKTNVEQTQIEDLDNLLGMPGAESIITQTDEAAEPEAPSFFTSKKVDLSVLNPKDDNDPVVDPVVEATTDPAVAPVTDPISDENLADIIDTLTTATDEEGEGNTAGRPKLDKDGMSQLAEKLIEKKLILPFEDEKPMADYTMDDFIELFEVNINEKERQVREKTPTEFFDALPPELQQAAQYVASGGQDLKGLFKHLASAEEIKDLNPETERGQETIVREYLRTTDFGNEEDIQEEIESWKDLGTLEDKALKFKPKLDKMQEKVVQRQVMEQETKRKQQENASHVYMENVYETLQGGELNGIKLNGKIQNMLYAGMVQPNYPSISGKQTNLFGHLIEKYQFVEPRHDLIAEALWLLADADGYKDQIRSVAKNEQVVDTARTLKTEQANKNNTGQEPNLGDKSRKPSGLSRPTKDFFKRD